MLLLQPVCWVSHSGWRKLWPVTVVCSSQCVELICQAHGLVPQSSECSMNAPWGEASKRNADLKAKGNSCSLGALWIKTEWTVVNQVICAVHMLNLLLKSGNKHSNTTNPCLHVKLNYPMQVSPSWGKEIYKQWPFSVLMIVHGVFNQQNKI